MDPTTDTAAATAAADGAKTDIPEYVGQKILVISLIENMLDRDLSLLARYTGAVERYRVIKNGAQLLFAALLYGDANSVTQVAFWLEWHTGARISKSALRERLQKAGSFMKELFLLLQASKAGLDASGWQGISCVDGTGLQMPASEGTDVRLHVSFDPLNFQSQSVDVTDQYVGEQFRHEHVQRWQLQVGDRGYAFAKSIAEVIQGQGELLVRCHLGNIKLFDPNRPCMGGACPNTDCAIHKEAVRQQKAEDKRQARAARQPRAAGKEEQGQRREQEKQYHRFTAQELAALAEKEGGCDLPVLLRLPAGELFPLRLALAPLPPEQAERARQAYLKKKAKGKKPQALTLALAGYLCLLTTLPAELFSPAVLGTLYRLRWQVELFFRLNKSILGLDKLATQDPDLMDTFCYSKLVYLTMLEQVRMKAEAARAEDSPAAAGQREEAPAQRPPTSPVSVMKVLDKFCSSLLYHVDDLARFLRDAPEMMERQLREGKRRRQPARVKYKEQIQQLQDFFVRKMSRLAA